MNSELTTSIQQTQPIIESGGFKDQGLEVRWQAALTQDSSIISFHRNPLGFWNFVPTF
jgi:hypothetical protein